jgi:hypothetical protein
MKRNAEIEHLWSEPAPEARPFHRTDITGLAEPSRLYLEHAIVEGAPIASAVRLWMHGEIKLGTWRRFEAEQVIDLRRGMIWSASVRMGPLRVSGFDRILDGEGAMSWKALGLIPVMTESGADITRSAIGRLAAELIWLPSAFLVTDVTWSYPEHGQLRAVIQLQGEEVEPKLIIDRNGRLLAVRLWRWGNPEGGDFRFVEFGAMVAEEKTFAGYTVPGQVRVGWNPRGDQFDSDGEFFRGFLDGAAYR